MIDIFNAAGKPAAGLSSDEFGGYLETYNEHEVRTGYFGTNKSQDGIVVVSDRYGDTGWTASGKK